MSRFLIAIDPGDNAGIAVFEDAQLVQVHLVIAASERCFKWDGPYNADVVCEMPEKYVRSRVSPNNLITLAYRAGYMVGCVSPKTIKLVYPKQWKGQRSKTIDNAQTLKLLNNAEMDILNKTATTKSKLHNVLDAVGVGLWALKRKEKYAISRKK